MIHLLLSSITTDWVWLLIFTKFLDHTQRRTTVGRTPLDEWPAHRRDFYLTTHNNYNRQTSVPSVGFEPMARAGKQPQTYALDRAATGTSFNKMWKLFGDCIYNLGSRTLVFLVREQINCTKCTGCTSKCYIYVSPWVVTYY